MTIFPVLNLLFFCSFVLSSSPHFYFIFFSPYLLNLFSFISQLFLTTTLLLLSTLTAFVTGCLETGFLLSAYNIVSKQVSSKAEINEDEELEDIPELEECSTVFDEITVEVIENHEIEEESPLHWPHGIVEGKGLGRKREERETLASYLFKERENEDAENENRMDLLWEVFPGLKFSAGKLKLGKRKPNCMIIQKPFKGIGLFSRLQKTRIPKQ
ncbi:hypothetical protein Nepgr_029760 [Nepenthes gracilis]|uniref:Transmembrane protein n=1 Tax=Nepenthes gracilis TaxID=150966 RepID=A0AAD3TFY1_NEPGR|nr:hypothetical protein Nepgr_029760 [Nepenthes gracilis]